VFGYRKGPAADPALNRDRGWDAVFAAGLEPVRQVAIDAAWSALRFRKPAHIKTMTRKAAHTAAGRARVAARPATKATPAAGTRPARRR
jgi:hypothetical protein